MTFEPSAPPRSSPPRGPRRPPDPKRKTPSPRWADRRATRPVDRWSVVVRWLAPLAWVFWMALALYLTLVPGDDLVELARAADPRLGHVLLFGGWTFLYGLLLMETLRRYTASIPWIVVTGILFGALVELLQSWMPFGRTGSAADIGFDALGALVAGAALSVYRSWRGWQREPGQARVRGARLAP